MSDIQYVPYYPRSDPSHTSQGVLNEDVSVWRTQGYAQPLPFDMAQMQSMQPQTIDPRTFAPAASGSRPDPIITADSPSDLRPGSATPSVVGSEIFEEIRSTRRSADTPPAVDHVGNPFVNLASSPEPTTSQQPKPLRVRPITSRLPIEYDTRYDTNPLPTKGPEHSSSSITAPRETSADKKRKLSPERPPAPAPTPASSTSEIKMSQIRELISPAKLRENKPVPLFKLLRTRIINDVPQKPMFEPNASELREILAALKNSAPAEYLRKMADDEKYTVVLRKWLLKTVKEPREWEKITAPLLGMLARTDMPVDFVIDFKFGRYAKQAFEKAQELGLASKREIQVAYKAYEEWVRLTLLPKNRRSEDAEEEDAAAKKRKLDDGSAKPQASSKPSASASSSTAPKPPIKKDTSAASSSKVSTDMSFFGAPSAAPAQPKPRAKLPDIKKRDPVSATAAPATSSVPNLLQKTMRSLQNAPAAVPRKPSVTEAPPLPVVEKKADVKKPNKKGFIVRFVDLVENGGPLEAVKLFKQEPHELERPPWATDTDGSTAHELDMAEGRALRQHEKMEEDIDWYEPEEFVGALPVPEPTPEALEQDRREMGILAINYPSGGVPYEPDERGVRIVERTPQTGMWYPHESAPQSQPQPVAAPAAPAGDVSALLGSLNPTLLFGQQQPAPTPQYSYGQPLPPLGQQQAYGYGGYPQQQPQAAGWRPPQHGGYNYGGNDWQSQNRPGFGHGQPVKKKNGICRFWRAGDCMHGDNCRYMHS